MIMEHRDFIIKLAEFGILVSTVFDNSEASNNSYLCINNIQIAPTNYESFGYFCGGAYNPCAPIKDKIYSSKDVVNAIKSFNEISSKELLYWQRQLNYHDIIEFLSTFGIKQVDKNSASRIIKALRDNFQQLIKKKIK